MNWLSRALFCIIIILLFVHIARSARADEPSIEDRISFFENRIERFDEYSDRNKVVFLMEFFRTVKDVFYQGNQTETKMYQERTDRLINLFEELATLPRLPIELRSLQKEYFPPTEVLPPLTILDSMDPVRQEILAHIYYPEPGTKPSQLRTIEMFPLVYEMDLWRNVLLSVILLPHFQEDRARITMQNIERNDLNLKQHRVSYIRHKRRNSRP
jgi:hypothetical protein